MKIQSIRKKMARLAFRLATSGCNGECGNCGGCEKSPPVPEPNKES